MNDAQQALIKLLEDGPDFRIGDGTNASLAAKIQYAQWIEVRIKPLLTELLSHRHGGTTFAGNVSAGGDVAGGDIQQK